MLSTEILKKPEHVFFFGLSFQTNRKIATRTASSDAVTPTNNVV